MKSLNKILRLGLCVIPATILIGCGGTKATPSLWEQSFTENNSFNDFLVKSSEQTVSRIKQSDGKTEITDYNLDGESLGTLEFDVNISRYSSLVETTGGFILHSDQSANMAMFDQDKNLVWHFQQPAEDGYTATSDIFINKETNSVVFSSINDSKETVVSIVSNGELINNTVLTGTANIHTQVAQSGDFTYVYVLTPDADYTGILHILDNNLNTVKEISNIQVQDLKPVPNGVTYRDFSGYTAIDANGDQLWQFGLPSHINVRGSLAGTDYLYIMGENSYSDTQTDFTLAVPFVRQYDYNGNLLWEFKVPDFAIGLEVSNFKLAETDNDRLIFTYKQRTSAPVRFVDTRYTITMKHQLLDLNGDLVREVVEASYRYDQPFCFKFCTEDPIPVSAGKSSISGVVESRNDEIISLSRISGSDTIDASLTAY